MKLSTLFFATTFFASVLVSLSSCSVLPEADQVSLYSLPTTRLTSHSAEQLNWSLRLEKPGASNALSGDRILVSTHPVEYTVLPGARWVDPAPKLLQKHLASAFLADGRIPQLSLEQNSLQADRQLGGILQGFQVELYQGTQQVVIRFDGVLFDTSSRNIIANRSFNISEPLAGTTPTDMVNAFGIAADNLAAEILTWFSTIKPATDSENLNNTHTQE